MIADLRLCVTRVTWSQPRPAVAERHRERERERERERAREWVVSCQQVVRQVLLSVYFNFSSPRSPSFPDFPSVFSVLQSVSSCRSFFSASYYMLFIVLGRLGAEQ